MKQMRFVDCGRAMRALLDAVDAHVEEQDCKVADEDELDDEKSSRPVGLRMATLQVDQDNLVAVWRMARDCGDKILNLTCAKWVKEAVLSSPVQLMHFAGAAGPMADAIEEIAGTFDLVKRKSKQLAVLLKSRAYRSLPAGLFADLLRTAGDHTDLDEMAKWHKLADFVNWRVSRSWPVVMKDGVRMRPVGCGCTLEERMMVHGLVDLLLPAVDLVTLSFREIAMIAASGLMCADEHQELLRQALEIDVARCKAAGSPLSEEVQRAVLTLIAHPTLDALSLPACDVVKIGGITPWPMQQLYDPNFYDLGRERSGEDTDESDSSDDDVGIDDYFRQWTKLKLQEDVVVTLFSSSRASALWAAKCEEELTALEKEWRTNPKVDVVWVLGEGDARMRVGSSKAAVAMTGSPLDRLVLDSSTRFAHVCGDEPSDLGKTEIVLHKVGPSAVRALNALSLGHLESPALTVTSENASELFVLARGYGGNCLLFLCEEFIKSLTSPRDIVRVLSRFEDLNCGVGADFVAEKHDLLKDPNKASIVFATDMLLDLSLSSARAIIASAAVSEEAKWTRCLEYARFFKDDKPEEDEDEKKEEEEDDDDDDTKIKLSSAARSRLQVLAEAVNFLGVSASFLQSEVEPTGLLSSGALSDASKEAVSTFGQGAESEFRLTDDEKKCLLSWLPGGRRVGKLLYRASRDGFAPKTFHARCDGKGPTLLIAQAHNGRLFGGYTSASWTSAAANITDPTSFLFTLRGGEDTPRKKHECLRKYAIVCAASQGPSFGLGPDLAIANGYPKASSSFPYSFNMLDESKCLAGERSFWVEDYEVYSVLAFF